VFNSFGKLGINIKDMFSEFITYPKFVLAMKFSIEKTATPVYLYPVIPTPFQHDVTNFQFYYEKKPHMMLSLDFW
jgi:hypothetical protein